MLYLYDFLIYKLQTFDDTLFHCKRCLKTSEFRWSFPIIGINLFYLHCITKLLIHCVKSVQIRSFFGPYFPVFRFGQFSRSVNEIWNKKNMEITSSSGICKVIYHHVKFIFLFGNGKWQSFEISYVWFLLFWDKRLLLWEAVVRRVVLKNFANFTGKHTYWSLF